MYKDFLQRDLAVGDVIAYALSGDSSRLQLAKVLVLKSKTNISRSPAFPGQPYQMWPQTQYTIPQIQIQLIKPTYPQPIAPAPIQYSWSKKQTIDRFNHTVKMEVATLPQEIQDLLK